MRVPRRALGAPSLEVAPTLLGATLAHRSDEGVVAVRLTEVEAYAGALDPGSHAFRGRTPRTEVMFGPAGHLYVYFTYGMHWCVNVVCGPDGEASAVLLRAGEVVDGVELARHRRPSARRDDELARGPARLASALGLDRRHDGADLCLPRSVLRLQPAADPARDPARDPAPDPARDPASGPSGVVRTGPRVGVSGPGGDADRFPWRFWLDGEPTVSAYRAAPPRRRSSHRPATLAPGGTAAL